MTSQASQDVESIALPTTRLQQLRELGQSVWINTLDRSMINSGELQRYIDFGVTGITSNPTTFEHAIAGLDVYDDQIRRFLQAGWDNSSIYEELVVSDVRRACDLLRSTFQRSNGINGYVSLEVSPSVAYDTMGTLTEARRLHAAIDRPNVMIKIPATGPGIPAIAEALFEGINVNVALLFSVDVYQEVIEAYIQALERRLAAGESIDRIASVASFPLNQLDAEVDRHLQEIVDRDPASQSGMLASCLLGMTGIANARVAYSEFRKAFDCDRFARLRRAGGRVQRPLWSSTSTNNPAYPAHLYIEALIGPDTVNSITATAVQSFLANGRPVRSIDLRRDEARYALASLADLGIPYPDIGQALVEQSIAAFTESFRTVLDTLARAREGVSNIHLDLVHQLQ